MTRNCLLLLAAATTLALAGCAHCDTCDDFPIPCQGGNCGGGFAGPTAGLPGMGPMLPPPAPGPDAPATAPASPASAANGADLGTAPSLPAAPETPPQQGAPKM